MTERASLALVTDTLGPQSRRAHISAWRLVGACALSHRYVMVMLYYNGFIFAFNFPRLSFMYKKHKTHTQTKSLNLFSST